MAYENYTFVSWTDGTPITGDRLAQMSTNIDQVKDATDDKPYGLLKFKTVTSTNEKYDSLLIELIILGLSFPHIKATFLSFILSGTT